MSLILFFALAMQSTTTCHTVAGTTRCTSDSGTNWQDMLRDQQAERAREIEERNRQASIANEASKERRARAYEQVGALIAAGKCEDAKRLAKFYDKPDIIKDTARACP